MDRSSRALVYGLLIVIVLIGVGSGMFVIGLNVGRAEAGSVLAAAPASTNVPPEAEAPPPLATPRASNGDIESKLELFREAYDIIQSEFYGEMPGDDDLVYGAIRGMLQRLDDRYTAFLEPRIAELDREARTGTYGGIGALVDLSDSLALEIVRVFRGSPAEEQGIQAGDQVIAVDGESIIGFSLDEMVTLVRGPAGTDVMLTVVRQDAPEPFDVTVTRAQIQIPLTESRMIGEDIAYISLSQFDATAVGLLGNEIASLLARNPKGLILDLRGNPGGFLDQAIAVSDLFLDRGVVMIERSRNGDERRLDSQSGEVAESIPLVVLVDGGSASASEIVAGAIQDRGRGTVIGTLTFGKGSVQSIHALTGGSELRVTTARWFTPNDRAIHGEGLEPDIVVEPGEDTAQDPQLDRAVEFLRTGQ